jgi:hypothetical protein
MSEMVLSFSYNNLGALNTSEKLAEKVETQSNWTPQPIVKIFFSFSVATKKV